MVVDQEESGPGASVSRKLPQCPKEVDGLAPTVINIWGSSGVIRTGACVATPRAPSVWIILRVRPLKPVPLGQSLLQRGPLQADRTWSWGGLEA